MTDVQPKGLEPGTADPGSGRPKIGSARFWIVIWLALSALLYVLIPSSGAWIELFNGATWPESLATSVSSDLVKRVPFAVVLAARTLLNLGSAAVIVYALYWFLIGRTKAMDKTLANVRAIQYSLLQFHLVTFLREHEGETVSPELIELFKARLKDWQRSDAAKAVDDDLVKVATESQIGA